PCWRQRWDGFAACCLRAIRVRTRPPHSSPACRGGATEMAIPGERFGAKTDRIALAQSLRILMVVVTILLTLTLFGTLGADAYVRVMMPVHAAGLTQLLAVGLLGGALLAWLRVPLVKAVHVTTVLIPLTTTAPRFRFAKRLSARDA